MKTTQLIGRALGVLGVLALVGCASAGGAQDSGDDESHEVETPPQAAHGEMLVSQVSCTVQQETAYTQGQASSIEVITIGGKPVAKPTGHAFLKMQKAAHDAGVSLTINSGFRTMKEQQYLYNCYLNKNCNNGNLAAKPGYSKHQNGLALDLTTSSWLAKNAAKYGFVRTVPSEAWHYEYTGGSDPGGPCSGSNSSPDDGGNDPGNQGDPGSGGNAGSAGSGSNPDPGSAGGGSAAPKGWTCDPSWYADQQYCDDNCGVADPDCASSGGSGSAGSSGSSGSSGSAGSGSAGSAGSAGAGGGSAAPKGWTCDPTWYSDGTCDENCGVADPDCAGGQGGSSGSSGSSGSAGAGSSGSAPSGWTCDPSWYNDGTCDDACGAADPDCAGAGSAGSAGSGSAGAGGSAPSGWKCDPSWYADGQYCDENCGVADPDCASGQGGSSGSGGSGGDPGCDPQNDPNCPQWA